MIDLHKSDHAELERKAREAGMTISNFVRHAVGLPLERQGVKRDRPARGLKRARKGA